MKKTLIAGFLVILLVCLIGCASHNPQAEEKAQPVVKAFSDGNVSEITSLVFGENTMKQNYAKYDDLLPMPKDNENSNGNGVLETIFDRVSVKIKESNENTIVFEITAPDMRNVFTELTKNYETISEEELSQYIRNYANATKKMTSIVSLEYDDRSGEPTVNYRNEKFINAVTGGMLDAYKALFSQMLEEFREMD